MPAAKRVRRLAPKSTTKNAPFWYHVEPTISRPVYLVSKPTRSMSRACRAVEQITLEVARDLVRRGIWEGNLIEG